MPPTYIVLMQVQSEPYLLRHHRFDDAGDIIREVMCLDRRCFNPRQFDGNCCFRSTYRGPGGYHRRNHITHPCPDTTRCCPRGHFAYPSHLNLRGEGQRKAFPAKLTEQPGRRSPQNEYGDGGAILPHADTRPIGHRGSLKRYAYPFLMRAPPEPPLCPGKTGHNPFPRNQRLEALPIQGKEFISGKAG